MTEEFREGDVVKVVSERGIYRVWRDGVSKDGSVLLYGGDTNPNGNRGFRSVMPEKLVRDNKRKKGV